VEVQLHQFLTSALDGGEWSASRPGRFSLRLRAHGTHWVGGLSGSQSQCGRGGEEKKPRHFSRRY